MVLRFDSHLVIEWGNMYQIYKEYYATKYKNRCSRRYRQGG